MNTDTPETDAVWNDKNQNILEHAKKMERDRDQLKRWKYEMETVGGWWLAVDEAIRKHPDATIGDTTPNIMLRFIRERNEAHSAIAALNQRLQERQESFQAQLIRIEEVWREKLTESRKDSDRLYNCLLETGDCESGDNSYMKNVLAQHEELVRENCSYC